MTSAARSLRRILELEESLTAETRKKRSEGNASSRDILALSGEQERITGFARELLSVWDRTGFSAGERVKFEIVAEKRMPHVVSLLRSAAISEKRRSFLDRSVAEEVRIVRAIREILGSLESLADEIEKGRLTSPAGRAEWAGRRTEALEKLRRDLEKFVEEQKNVIGTSEKLVGKRVDDFTQEELDRLEDLARTEEKWAGVIAAGASALAKLASQDLSDSTLVDELIEASSEVDAAADALSRREVEIAVPLEQSGLELAEELTTNIERWLSDVPDKIKWSMEDPVADVEVPLADLPKELEDLVGELIDSEETLTEDVEDVTSGWIDSLDKGAGWTVADGPISNMSAKGITGNLLPNQHEIGGRSGEGRSGRSHGQIVEKEATGKGGRPTPTRVTPDAFEQGTVKDTGKDPTGGATGGGKLAGAAPEGLRGPVSPDVAERLRRLGAQQSRIRTRAERALKRLRTLRFTATGLERAVAVMRALERELKEGRPENIARLHDRTLRTLRHAEASIASRSGLRCEPSGAFPEEIARGMADPGAEPVPGAYEDLIREYFEKLSGGVR